MYLSNIVYIFNYNYLFMYDYNKFGKKKYSLIFKITVLLYMN